MFDTALLLLAIYHLIEWIKTTFLLTVVCVGINLMAVWYILCLNTIFGVITIVYTMIVVFSEEGAECCEAQIYRGWWLKAEIITFWCLFFLYPGPLLPLRMCSKKSHDELINRNSDDESDEDDD